MDPAQYEWMLSELLDLYQNYPNEDEIMMQYLLPALCKALAVLKMVSIDCFSNLVYCLTGKEYVECVWKRKKQHATPRTATSSLCVVSSFFHLGKHGAERHGLRNIDSYFAHVFIILQSITAPLALQTLAWPDPSNRLI